MQYCKAIIFQLKINNFFFKKDLNLKPDTIKLLEENIGRKLFDINHSNIFLDPSPTVMKKIKINKWGLINLKTFAQQRKP